MMRIIREKGPGLLLSVIIFLAFLLIGFGDSSAGTVVLLMLLLSAAGILMLIIPLVEESAAAWTNRTSLRSAAAVAAFIVITALALSCVVYTFAVKPADPVTISSIREAEEEKLEKENEKMMKERLYPDADEEKDEVNNDTGEEADRSKGKGNSSDNDVSKVIIVTLLAVIIFSVLMYRPLKHCLFSLRAYVEDKRAQREILNASGRQRVILAFREICGLLSDRGHIRKPSMTALEYARQLQSSDISESAGVAEAARIYEKVIYTDYTPPAEECDMVKDLYMEINEALGQNSCAAIGRQLR